MREYVHDIAGVHLPFYMAHFVAENPGMPRKYAVGYLFLEKYLRHCLLLERKGTTKQGILPKADKLSKKGAWQSY
jgi:hypothetical protein